jgi:hypothetical protein
MDPYTSLNNVTVTQTIASTAKRYLVSLFRMCGHSNSMKLRTAVLK